VDDVTVDPASTPRRSPPPWLPLLQLLTRRYPAWGVWKNADSALAGFGDVDSVARRLDHGSIADDYTVWATEHSFLPVIVCPHLPGSTLVVGVREEIDLVELQLCSSAVFRGSRLFQAEALTPLMFIDDRGFRRLRPGAEGLLLLFHNGMKRGGRPFPEGWQRKGLDKMMRDDPDGMESAARIFGPAARAALRSAQAVLEGGWDRAAALEIELWATLRSLKEPRLLASRGAFRVAGDIYCPVLMALQRERRVPGDYGRWIARVATSHDIRSGVR
jgi:hypothetical protein